MDHIFLADASSAERLRSSDNQLLALPTRTQRAAARLPDGERKQQKAYVAGTRKPSARGSATHEMNFSRDLDVICLALALSILLGFVDINNLEMRKNFSRIFPLKFIADVILSNGTSEIISLTGNRLSFAVGGERRPKARPSSGKIDESEKCRYPNHSIPIDLLSMRKHLIKSLSNLRCTRIDLA